MITAFVVIDALMERQGARVPDAEIVMIAVVATNSDRIKKPAQQMLHRMESKEIPQDT
jgi:hypothetical protein